MKLRDYNALSLARRARKYSTETVIEIIENEKIDGITFVDNRVYYKDELIAEMNTNIETIKDIKLILIEGNVKSYYKKSSGLHRMYKEYYLDVVIKINNNKYYTRYPLRLFDYKIDAYNFIKQLDNTIIMPKTNRDDYIELFKIIVEGIESNTKYKNTILLDLAKNKYNKDNFEKILNDLIDAGNVRWEYRGKYKVLRLTERGKQNKKHIQF